MGGVVAPRGAQAVPALVKAEVAKIVMGLAILLTVLQEGYKVIEYGAALIAPRGRLKAAGPRASSEKLGGLLCPYRPSRLHMGYYNRAALHFPVAALLMATLIIVQIGPASESVCQMFLHAICF